MNLRESASDESNRVVEAALEEEPLALIDPPLLGAIRNPESLSEDSTMPLRTLSGIPPVDQPDDEMGDDSTRQSVGASSGNLHEPERMVSTLEERDEQNDKAVDRIVPSSSIADPVQGGTAREGDQDAGGKHKKRRKLLPIINQPPVSLHNASNIQHQPMQYPTRIAQCQLMQPGPIVSPPTLPLYILAPINSYPLHYPYNASNPVYNPSYASYMSWPMLQHMQSLSQQPLQNQSSISEPGLLQYGESISQPSRPLLDPNRTSASPTTLALGFNPYNPANYSTHLQGPMPQFTQPLHLDHMPQARSEATQRPSTSMAFQTEDVIDVPSSREDDEKGRSERTRKRGRRRKNTGPK